MVGGTANMAVIYVNSIILYPMPAGVSFSDAESFGLYVAQLPALAFLMVWVAHGLQTELGGYVASRIVSSSGTPKHPTE
jgi:hypothetical protein